MSGYPFRRRDPTDAGVAAAQWALRHSGGGPHDVDEPRFAAWLDADPDNAAAYVDALWALDAVARHAGEPEILALRHAALAARGNRRWRWTVLGGGAMAAAAAAAALLAWASLPRQAPVTAAGSEQVAQRKAARAGIFRTGIGERAAIDLPDGSVVTLDTDSEIRVAYTPQARAIYLASGQALFEVAHGRPQPFQVFARGQLITAVGTVFNVRIEGPAVRVSMVDGMVKLRHEDRPGPAAAPFAELTLTAGEAALAGPDRAAAVERDADVRKVTAWKGGMLVFADTPLLDAVAEINRYTRQPIAIADAGVAAYRVNGVFKTNDPEHFSQAMAEVLPIEVTRAPDGSATLRARRD